MAGINFVDNTNRPRLDDRVKSAWHVFVGVAIPAATAGVAPPITLEVNAEGWKTPSTTGNPNALYLGCSVDGLTLTMDKQTTDDFCDESPDPESTTTTSRKLSLAGNYLGVLDEKLLKTLYGMTEWSVDGDSFRHLADAGDVSNPSMSVLVISRRPGDTAGTYKYQYVFLPSCEQTASFPTGKLSSKERMTAPVNFVAKAYAAYGNRAFTTWVEE